MQTLRNAIRNIPDFPTPGILFYDITPLLQEPRTFQLAIDTLCNPYIGSQVDVVVGIDARGFLFAPAIAYKLGKGLAIIRKKGKLPFQTHAAAYSLEYGEAEVEMHVDAVQPGQRVLIVDDVLATGGTAKAAGELVRKAGGQVFEYAFLIELPGLGGRARLSPDGVHSLLKM